MDMSKVASREDHLHICHVDKEKLENGKASIVEVSNRDRQEVEIAHIDQDGYFREVWTDNYFHRDWWEVEG